MSINDTLCRENLHRQLENFSYFLNETYYREPYIFKHLSDADYVKIATYVVIILVGLIGNVSILLIVTLIRSMRTTINYYIANLAFADALICLFCMVPHVIGTTTTPVFILGEFMCKFDIYAQMCCMTCSVLTLSAISCDRFVAIMYPLRVRITKQRPSIVMACVWIISLGVSIPFLIVKRHTVIQFANFMETRCLELWPIDSYWDAERGVCVDHHLYQIPYYLTVSITLYFLPVTVMVCAYSMILRKLWKSEAPGEQNTQNANLQEKSRKKVIKLVFIVLIAFTVCWTPFQIFVLVSAFPGGFQVEEWFQEYKWFAYFLAYANSFINPIIYGGFNKTFRDGYLSLLKCECHKKGFRRPNRSRPTFTTGFTSSLSRFTSRFINNAATTTSLMTKVSPENTFEMKNQQK